MFCGEGGGLVTDSYDDGCDWKHRRVLVVTNKKRGETKGNWLTGGGHPST